MKLTQGNQIIAYLLRNETISSFEAFRELHCSRLAARIHDLEQEGYTFKRFWVAKKNEVTGETIRFMRYALEGKKVS